MFETRSLGPAAFAGLAAVVSLVVYVALAAAAFGESPSSVTLPAIGTAVGVAGAAFFVRRRDKR